MLETQSNWENWDNLMLNLELQRASSFAVDGVEFGIPFGGNYGEDGSC
jgi:hypothetical protein